MAKDKIVNLRVSQETIDALKAFAHFNNEASITSLVERALVLYITNRVKHDSVGVVAPFYQIDDLESVCETFGKFLAAKRRTLIGFKDEPGALRGFHFDDVIDADGKLLRIIKDGDGNIINPENVTAYLHSLEMTKKSREESGPWLKEQLAFARNEPNNAKS